VREKGTYNFEQEYGRIARLADSCGPPSHAERLIADLCIICDEGRLIPLTKYLPDLHSSLLVAGFSSYTALLSVGRVAFNMALRWSTLEKIRFGCLVLGSQSTVSSPSG
jgi:hypothetical protein